jgi:hypothetical protein
MAYAGILKIMMFKNPRMIISPIVFCKIILLLSHACHTIPSNATPVVNAGLDYTIPFGTAFV